MSLQPPTRARPVEDEGTATDPKPDEVLALLDDDYTRAILEAIRAEAKPARALAEECDASRPTVYRRLNDLEDAGLVASTMAYDADGHHRTVFESTLDELTVGVGEDGFSVSVSTTDRRERGSGVATVER